MKQERTRPSYDVTAGVAHLRASHPRMAVMIDRVGACSLETHTRQPFEALVQSIVYQQLNGRAAATILGRVVALYTPKRFPTAEDLLATDDATLRAAGLSRAKTLAVKSLAQHFIDGVVPTRAQAMKLSNDDLVERLTNVRGIGRWTVEMFLIFGLSRPDVWPVLDFCVRKGLGRTFGKRKMPTPKQAQPYVKKFSPYSSVAAWYFWRASELKDQTAPPKKVSAKSPRR